jgi:hypothetical protein
LVYEVDSLVMEELSSLEDIVELAGEVRLPLGALLCIIRRVACA